MANQGATASQAAAQVMGQQQGQPQQPQRSSILPTDTPSIDEQLAMMKREFSEEVKQQEEKTDLFAPQTQDPSTHQEEVNDWLAPVSADTTVPTVMQVGRDSEHYKHFEEQFSNDPAVQAIAPQAMELANGLRQKVQSGEMTYDEAMSHAGRILDKYATGVFDEHHSDKTKPRTLVHPDVLAGTHRMGGR